MANRTDKWRDNDDRFIMEVRNGDSNPMLVEALKQCPQEKNDSGVFWRLGGSRELILHYKNPDEFELEAINFALDAATGELVLGHGWRAIKLSRDDVKEQLAHATAYSIPVYPNNEESSQYLQAIYADLIANGIEVEHEGKMQRLVWDRGDAITFGGDSTVVLSPTESFFPADALVLAAELERQHASVSEAVRTLAELRRAVDELAGLLSRSVRDEAALQTCLNT